MYPGASLRTRLSTAANDAFIVTRDTVLVAPSSHPSFEISPTFCATYCIRRPVSALSDANGNLLDESGGALVEASQLNA